MAVGTAIDVDLSCSGGGGAGTCMSEDAFKERSKSDREDDGIPDTLIGLSGNDDGAAEDKDGNSTFGGPPGHCKDGDMDENAGFANNILESGSTAPVPRGKEAPVGCPKSRPDPAVCKSNDKSGTDDRV